MTEPEDGPADGLPAEERAALRAYLAGLGADEARIDQADADRTLGPLAVELTVAGDQGRPFYEALAATNTDVELATRLWRALGFPDPAVSEPTLQPGEDASLGLLMTVGSELLGMDATLTIARLIGTTTSQLADALVDSFRMQVEVPGRSAGTPYPEMVRNYAEILHVALPQLELALGACLRRHLIAAAAAAWTVDEDSTTARRDLVVGFADLTGWTSLSRSSTPARLAQLVQRFEQHLSDAAAPYQVRVVKLLGDGAMVVCADADAACAFALDLVARIALDGELPPVRVGLAAGQVMVLGGDHHGEVVNLAARLGAAAPAGGVLVDDEVRARAARTAFDPPSTAELRGFETPVSSSRVLPA
jgi:adenylate cyclase